MDKLPQRLKTARIAKNLSQRELAEKVGVGQSVISRVEGGHRGTTTDKLADIAKVLDVTLSELVGDADRSEENAYGPDHPANQLLDNYNSPDGLRSLASNRSLVNALKISEDEWRTLISTELPEGVTQDGYVQLLITIRAISPGIDKVN